MFSKEKFLKENKLLYYYNMVSDIIEDMSLKIPFRQKYFPDEKF